MAELSSSPQSAIRYPLTRLFADKNDLTFGLHRAAALLEADRKRSRRLDRLDRMEARSDKPQARDRQNARANRDRFAGINHPKLVIFPRRGRRQFVQLEHSISL